MRESRGISHKHPEVYNLKPIEGKFTPHLPSNENIVNDEKKLIVT